MAIFIWILLYFIVYDYSSSLCDKKVSNMYNAKTVRVSANMISKINVILFTI